MTRTLPSGSPCTETLSSRAADVQARAESVAAPLVRAHAPNIEVLTDFQPVNTLGNLGVLAGLLNSRTKIRVLERDAMSVATGGIDNLSSRDETVGVNPVAPSPTVGRGQVADLLAVAFSLCGREFWHSEPRAGVDSPAGIVSRAKASLTIGAVRLPEEVQVGSCVSRVRVDDRDRVCQHKCCQVSFHWGA